MRDYNFRNSITTIGDGSVVPPIPPPVESPDFILPDEVRVLNRTTAASDRYDRSHDRSIESIDSIDSIILWISGFFGHVGELEICLDSKFQLCTALGGRKNAEKPKRMIF